MNRLSVLLNSDDTVLRDGMTRVLRASAVPLSLVEERASVVMVPNVVMVDIRRPEAGGLAAVEQLRAQWPAVSIFVVAGAAEPSTIIEAMRAGANEFFAWPATEPGAPPEVADAIRQALERLAERQQAAEGNRGRGSKVVAFFGAKGGAGTTTLAVNCSTEVARLTERSTVIVDFNPFLGEVALFLGVRPRFTLLDAVDNLQRLDPEFVAELVATHSSGLEILSGSDTVDRPSREDIGGLETLLAYLRRTHDFVVIDAGHPTNACAEVAINAADEIFLIATPDVPSIRNTQRLVDRIGQMGAAENQIRVLLNRTSEQHMIAPDQIATAVGRPIHHAFPSDYSTVSAALNSGVPIALHNSSPLAVELGRFARTVGNLPADDEAPVAGRRRSALLGLF